MPSADQVPTKSSHSRMLWHKWVVLIAGSTGSALRAVRPPNLHITPVVRRDVYSALAFGLPWQSALTFAVVFGLISFYLIEQPMDRAGRNYCTRMNLRFSDEN